MTSLYSANHLDPSSPVPLYAQVESILTVAIVDGTYPPGSQLPKEEELVKREKAIPYSLEEELKKRGAKYSKASLPFKSHVVEDGHLITGQNPASAHGVGQAVVNQLTAKA